VCSSFSSINKRRLFEAENFTITFRIRPRTSVPSGHSKARNQTRQKNFIRMFDDLASLVVVELAGVNSQVIELSIDDIC